MATRDVVERLARERLPREIAERWLTLLRPAARLRATNTRSEPVVGQLGGLPSLPDGCAWPEWPGQGPLSFIASIECAAVAGFDVDVLLPADGRLLFFYFDGRFNNFATFVFHGDPASLAGSRVLYLPGSTSTTTRAYPLGLEAYPRIDLTAERMVSYPNWEHDALADVFRGPGQTHREFMGHPVNADDFREALWELDSGPSHQIGGYAAPVQGPVEYEVAASALGGKVKWDSSVVTEEARRWRLLLQIDSDDRVDMMWGDAGTLYWLMRPHDLVEKNFAAASFTWQCA